MNFFFAIGLSCISGYSYYCLNYGRSKNAQTELISEESLESCRLYNIFQEALADLSIDKTEIKLLITNGKNAPCAYGDSISKNCGIIWPIDSLTNESDETILWIFKHEITHITKNHLLKIPFFSLLVGITPLAINCLFPFNPVISISLSVVTVVSTIFLYSQAAESEADAMALESSNKEGIQAAIDLFENERKNVILNRNILKNKNNWQYLLRTENGEKLLNLLHPSYSNRIAMCSNALK